jgi:hypothetical protein
MARNILPEFIDDGQNFSLSDEQLAALAENARFRLSNEHRKEIENLCRQYVIERDFERGAVPSRDAREICDELLKHTSALDKVLREVEGPNTAQEAVYLDLQERLSDWYPNSADPYVEVREALLALHDAADRTKALHRSCYGGRGRPPRNEALRDLIWQLANLVERANGSPTAHNRGDSGKPDSSFVRFVSALNGNLPESVRADARKLPEVVRSVLRQRKKRREKVPSVPNKLPRK